MIKIHEIEIRHLKIPLVSHFETSFSRVYHQETLIIRVTEGKLSGCAPLEATTSNRIKHAKFNMASSPMPLTGWGECPASAAPYYSAETVITAKYIIKDFISPIIINKSFSDLTHLNSSLHHIRGHNMAKAGVMMALTDLSARKRKIPLAKLYGGVQKNISSGISLGIQNTPAELITRIEDALRQGYQRIKIKIKHSWDVNIVSAMRKRFPKIALSVDANGAYKLYEWRILKALDKYNLMMIEQPFSNDDFVDHAELQRKIKTPICLDESIKSYHDAEQAIKLKSCRIINIKQARVGGPVEAIQIHNLCRKHKIPVWCGGLLESGIGRLHNIALASLPGFTLPSDISASSRYYKQDIINPPVTLQSDGTIKVSAQAGLGAEVVNNQVEQYTVSKEVISTE